MPVITLTDLVLREDLLEAMPHEILDANLVFLRDLAMARLPISGGHLNGSLEVYGSYLALISGSPILYLVESDQPSGQQVWAWRGHDKNMFLSRCDDEGAVQGNALSISETQFVSLLQAVLYGAAITGANRLIFGWPAAPMTEMWHSGSHQYMDMKTGGFYIRSNPGTADTLLALLPTWITLNKGTTLNGGAIVADVASLSVGSTQAALGLRAISGATLAIGRCLVPFELRTSDDTEYIARFVPNGTAAIYFDGIKRLETTAAGAQVSGRLNVIDADASNPVLYAQNTNAAFTGVVADIKSDRSAGAYHSLLRCVAGTDPQLLLNGVGQLSIDGPILQNQADDAHAVEWQDGNPDGEDRIGLAVYLVAYRREDRGRGLPARRVVRQATHEDLERDPWGIIGVVSGTAARVSNAAPLHWHGKWAVDGWGRPIEEAVTVVEWTPRAAFPASVEEAFDVETPAGYAHEPPQPLSREFRHLTPEDVATLDHDAELHECVRLAKSQDYDPERPYSPRTARPEYAIIGERGFVRMRAGQPAPPQWRYLGDSTPGEIEEWYIR